MARLNDDWFLRARLKMRHLQLFLAIDEHRNLHRAAESLSMNQPAASKLLNDLEEQLDVVLFDRHPRGMTPNWYGEIMVRHARSILSQLNHTGEEINAMRQGNAGVVAVGAVMAPAVTILTSAVERVHRDLPGLKVRIDVDVSKRLVPRLIEGEFDFVISRIPEGFTAERFVFEEIGEEDICIVCREGHPAMGDAPVQLADLTPFPWSLQPPGALLRQRVDNLFLHHGVQPPKYIVDTPDFLVSLALVDKSDTLTVTTRQVAEMVCAPQRFSVLPFGEPIRVQPYGLVTLRDKSLSPGAIALLDTLRDIINEPEFENSEAVQGESQ